MSKGKNPKDKATSLIILQLVQTTVRLKPAHKERVRKC